MLTDFNWVLKIINNEKNTPIHTKPILTLIDLFKRKWKDYDDSPQHKMMHKLYVDFLLKSLSNCAIHNYYHNY